MLTMEGENSVLDTTMRITLLCDGDKRLNQGWIQDINLEELRLEYLWNLCYEAGKDCAIVLRDMITPVLKQAAQLIKKICEEINFEIEEKLDERQKWYNPTDRNNYRKIHHMALRRVVRRRKRRSRDNLMGRDNPRAVVVDESEEE